MSSKIKGNVCVVLLVICISLYFANAFTFAELKVSAASTTTNVVTTYTIFYDRTKNTTGGNTTFNITPLNSSSNLVLNFPSQFSLSSNISCLYQTNTTGAFLANTCTLNGNQVIYSGIFTASTILANITLQISNVLNPYPAGKTSIFTGSIGNDNSHTGVNAFINVSPAASVCGFTFSPNYVYSTQNMIFTLTTVNLFPSTGTIGIQFPLTKLWSQELDSTRTMPINSSMVCNNQSANVNSALQCTGSSALVTLSNIVASALSGGSTISFSINNFISPPTNQAADAITVTTYTGTSLIDTCNAYVSGLVAKVIPSSQFTINEQNGDPLVVNQQFVITFAITTMDVISTSDQFVIIFPTGTSIINFNTIQITGYPSILNFNTTACTYLNQVLTLQMTSGDNISPQTLYITVSNFIAPPSTLPTANFKLTIMSNGYPKMVSYQSITAAAGLVSGTVTLSTNTVNAISSYAFTITTSDAITSSGMIKIMFPTILTFTNQSTSRAVITNSTNVVSVPNCTFSSLDNSITFSNLNSSSNSIPSQTMIITVNNIQNAPSTATTPSFTVSTYYTSSTSTLVDSGSINGVTATAATIDYTKVVISSSSLITSDTRVTYYFSFVVANPIPLGGFILLSYPLGIVFDLSTVNSSCYIMLNSTAQQNTPCWGRIVSSFYVFNFTNPIPSSSATIGTNITLIVANSATNPPSTQPVGPFSLQTYSSDGTIIASLLSSLSYQVTVPNSFKYNQFSRISNQNAAITSYTLSLSQTATLQPSDLLYVTFPANLVPYSNSSCSITYNNVSSAVTCGLTNSSTFKVVSISSSITGESIFSITFTNIRNPLSYSPLAGFSVLSKTANNAYSYSSSSSTNTLSNSVPSLFKTVTYLYSPQQLNTAVVLILTFQLSQYTLPPGYLQVTIDSYFSINSLTCSAFVDFTGSCTYVANQTIKVAGTFNSSVMGLTISGFTSRTYVPPTVTYTVLNSFDVSGYKMDESFQDISFQLACTLPCQTCLTTNTSSCLSCYGTALVTTAIYFLSNASQCYTTCPDTTYNNNGLLVCSGCSSNCYTCLGSANFCTRCFKNSIYPYLNITNSSTQICVASCSAGMYPNTALDPVTCVNCNSPCATCTSQIICLTCINGYYFLDNKTCVVSCPINTTVANNLTNTCDACSSICLRCVGTTSTCTACNSPLVFYNGSCQSSCPSGGTLAPYLGICTACTANCQTCSLTITNCTSCNLSSNYAYLVNYTCITSCPSYYYNQSSTGTCISCTSANINCVNCASSSTCITCDNSFLFFNSTCISYVPIGYVNISNIAVACNSNCATCSITTTNCTSCTTLNLQGSVCVSTCVSGTIPISNVCTQCSSPCKTCSVSLYNCTACLTNLTTSLFLNSYSCQATCPDFTYANSSNYQCTACNSPCSLCAGAAVCLSCINGTALYNSSCLSACPSGFAAVNLICQACTNNCKTCINATNICLSCNSGSYFLSSSSSCVTSCKPSLFIDYTTQSCVGCTSPCNTCINSSTTCLSCLTGFLYLSSCIDTCPDQMYGQSGTCLSCPSTCSSCSSLTNCSACTGTTYLYKTYCVTTCPATQAAVINGICTPCSTLNCYSCTTNDVCLICNSNYLYLKALCVSACPSGYSSNGTHCIDILASSLTTTSNAFPVPFSIAGVVIIIACLMSRLQFSETYMSGAIYSLISVLQWAALIYMLWLYFIAHMDMPVAFYVGLGSLVGLYILNIVAIISQSIFLFHQKSFQMWAAPSRFNRCFYVLASFISLLMSHKFRNILFCKLFKFGVFSAKLDKVEHFKIFNIFSLVSLVCSGAAIFAAGIAITKSDSTQQLYFECIDVIVLTCTNAVMAFFNTHKDKDFFQESTPDGHTLNKRNEIDQSLIGDKVSAHGNDGEFQQGFINKYSHALASKSALKFDDSSNYQAYSDNSLAHISQKSYQQISVQALDIIEEKANITAKTNPLQQQTYQPEYDEISVQACDMIFSNQKQQGINLSDIPQQLQNDTSNFTNYLHRVDRSAQGNLMNGVNQSIQMGADRVDQSAQNQRRLQDNVDISIQKSSKIEKVDISIQKFQYGQADVSVQNTNKASRVDRSMQNSDKRNDISVQPSGNRKTEQSVSMTYNAPKSFGMQQNASMSDKNYSARVSVVNQSNQFNVSQREEEMQIQADLRQEGIQPSIEYDEYGIQPSMEYNEVGVQPTLQVEDQDQSIPGFNQIAVQYQEQKPVQYKEFQDQLHNSNTPSNIIFEEDVVINRVDQRKLMEQRVEHMEIQPENIQSYHQELQQRIRQKQKELQQIKRKVDLKQKLNELKKQEILKKRHIQDEDIQVAQIRFVGQKAPSIASSKARKPTLVQNNQTIQQIKVVIDHLPTEPMQSKTIEQIQVQLKPAPPKQKNIQYKQSPNNFASQSQEQIDLAFPNQSLARNQLKQEYTQSPQTVVNKASPQMKFQYTQIQNNLQNLIEQQPVGFVRSRDRQAFSSQLKSQGNRESQATKKNYRRKNVVVDISQADRSLGGQEELEYQQQDNQSDHEPTGIVNSFQHTKPRFRGHSPSDMSGTIEEIPKHYSRVDNQKTINNDIEPQRPMPVTSRVDKDKVTNYVAQNVGSNQYGARARQIPAQKEGSQKYRINKLYSNNQPVRKQNEDTFPRNLQRDKKNTFAMAAQAQLNTEDLLIKKSTSKNPLKNQKNWEAQHEDKYISDEENDKQPNNFNRTNLVKRPVNKNLQNFASHLVLPQESDKQNTTFHQMAGKKEEKIARKARELSAQIRKPEAEEIEVHFEADQFSHNLHANGDNQSPNMPRTHTKRMTYNGQSSIYDDQSQDVNYKKMMILGQMQQRPNNDDLQGYYQRKRDSKEKPRRSTSKIDRNTQRIYLQRLDKNKK